MIAAARERGPDSFVTICLMGIHALQPAELTGLRVEHVQQRQDRPMLVIPDRERGTWTPLVPPTISAVEQLSAGRPLDAPLLTNDEGRAMTCSDLRYRVRQAAQAVGLNPVPTPRVLRTTAGALAMSRGIPIGQLQDLLGVEGINHIWKFAAQVKPYQYEHAAEAVAHLVIERGHLIEAKRLLLGNDVHPAVAVMTAGAAMEFALREWAREKGVRGPQVGSAGPSCRPTRAHCVEPESSRTQTFNDSRQSWTRETTQLTAGTTGSRPRKGIT